MAKDVRGDPFLQQGSSEHNLTVGPIPHAELLILIAPTAKPEKR
jgi:hypothetical protein